MSVVDTRQLTEIGDFILKQQHQSAMQMKL